MTRIPILIFCLQLLCVSCLVAQEGEASTPPGLSIEKMMVADEYGFYVDRCTMEYFVELHNPFEVPLDLINLFSTNGYRRPHFWRPGDFGIRVSPGKSLLVGIIDVRLRGLCDLDSFARSYPYYQFGLFCKFAVNAESKTVFRDGGYDLSISSREGWNDFRSCGIDSSARTRSPRPYLVTLSSPDAVDSLEISTDRFDYVIRGKSDMEPRQPERSIFGLVKLRNASSGYIVVDSIYTDDDVTDITGVPNWTRTDPCTTVIIPPGGSAVVEYKSRVIDERFDGDMKRFLEDGHSFTVFVRLRGSQKEPVYSTVQLGQRGLRRRVKVEGARLTRDGYDAPEN